MARWIFHIDMDAFYASVEQYRVHPQYGGLPVCVGPDPKQGKDRGVVRAASYEARVYGIHSGMSVLRAYNLCPEAIFLSSGFSNYFEASDEFMTVIERFADKHRIRRASIDEAYLEVTEQVKSYSGPKALAIEIQQTILEETKLPCSIGIAPNMAVAKIATNMSKPQGITLVPQDPSAVAHFLSPLEVSVINGIGRVTAKRLNKYGISTLGQIQQMTLADLVPIMGKGAKWLYDRAWGIDTRPVLRSGSWQRKSIGKDRTFMRDIDSTSEAELQETFKELCSRISDKLKSKSMYFRTVTVKIRYSDYSTIQRSRSLNVSTADHNTLWKTTIDLFDAHREPDRSLRLVGVRVTNLTPMNGQASLSDFF